MNRMDQSFELEREVRQEQGFTVYTLSNERVRLAVVPELGAKIASLRDLRTGREWLWHPLSQAKLFRNQPADDFSKSPLVGIDECLPTIAPCVWRGRKLPDHGEAWSVSWRVDEEAWQDGVLKTCISLNISPFDFERTIELEEDKILLSYRLHNRSSAPEYFLWALHPLLRVQPGDRLILPASTRAFLKGASWIDAIDSAIPEENCSKLFAGPLTDGFSGIQNQRTGERLDFEWNTTENNALGLWLTRGGWHGHHHFAIEPANAGADALTEAVAREWCGTLAGASTATWQVRLRIS
jgi:galactose mutarotase-like enzyme